MAEEKKITKKKRPTQEKRVMQNMRQQQKNRIFKSKVRTAIRSLEQSILDKDTENVEKRCKLVCSFMDKGVKRGVYKKNKAARTKSRFTKKIALK